MKEKKEEVIENGSKTKIGENELSERASLAELGSGFVRPDMEENDTDNIEDIVKEIRKSPDVSDDIKEELAKACIKADQIVKKTDGGNSKGKQEERKGMADNLHRNIDNSINSEKVDQNRDNSLNEKNKEER